MGAVLAGDLPQVGEARAKLLGKLGIGSLFDLLYYLPRRYEDRRINQAGELKPGEAATVWGIITSTETTATRRGLSVTKAELRTGGGPLTALWFNQPFVTRSLRRGLPVTVTGRIDGGLFGSEITVADYEIGNPAEAVHVGRIAPFYSTTEDLSQRALRRLMYKIVKQYACCAKDLLPPQVAEELHLPPLAESLRQVHFPGDFEALAKARERLAFEELFLFQLGLGRIQEIIQYRGVGRRAKSDLPEAFIEGLPFSLTPAQQRVLDEIRNDLAAPRRMYRLVQGDVGCGKTVIALYALLYVVAAGYQGALMAPTEVLAEQHYLGLKRQAERLGVRVAALTGGGARRQREESLEALRDGGIDIVVGTHALLEEGVVFDKLGLIVIDEQHRFGVRQRDILQSKAPQADVLVMTATPIPRSLTLTLYGDLELSVVDQLPPGRQGVKTYFLPEREKQRAYRFLRQELQAGRQAYVVCPLIEESEKLEVEAATNRASELQQEFPEYNVALLHGRLKMEEKARIMEEFRAGSVNILVATTVIEVGVDVANASLMIVEGVERFGLSQLHQLRGRVGRGQDAGYCILIGNPQTDEARDRVKTLVKHQDGFKVAEQDLAIRGPGELMGVRQHGLSDFRVVDIFKDAYLMETARSYAARYRDYVNEIGDAPLIHGASMEASPQTLLQEIGFRFPSLIYGLKF
jgi:ATP-dependent DNA helicase RecG